MVCRPRDLADRMAARRKPDDGFLRETFTLPRTEARTAAREFFTTTKTVYVRASGGLHR